MNVCDLPSDHVAAVRDHIKSAVHGGLRLDAESTLALAKWLTTIAELCREIEEENRILEHRLRVRGDDQRNRQTLAETIAKAKATNVRVLHPRPRRVPQQPGDAS